MLKQPNAVDDAGGEGGDNAPGDEDTDQDETEGFPVGDIEEEGQQ